MQRRSSPILLRLLGFARPYWRVVVLALLFVVGNTAFTLVMPYLLKVAIDEGLNVQTVNGVQVAIGNKSLLIWVGVAIVGVAALRGAAAFGQTYTSELLAWVSVKRTSQ